MGLQSRSKPVVHIATDEKFIDAAYKIYERAFPGKNLFLILLNKDQKEIKYLSDSIPYVFIKTDDQIRPKVKDSVGDAKMVMFHEMNSCQTEIALSLSEQDVALGWTVFGYEVYNNPYLFGKELYGEKTYAQFVKNCRSKIKNILRPYYHRIFRGQQDPFERKITVMEQMDIVGILYNEELQLYKERMNFNDDVKHLRFTYYPLDVVVNKKAKVPGSNIMLGNSASYTNNHLEAFDLLKEIDIGDRKIICPLSYGVEEYAIEIEKVGNKVFSSNFEPLINFLPLKAYQQVLQGCGIMIMNQYRQQAVGNVVNAMYMGAKVFLSNKNTLYHYLKRIGCYVYCVEEDLVPNNRKVLNLLDKEQIQHNQKLLKEELSLERICIEIQQKLNPIIS